MSQAFTDCCRLMDKLQLEELQQLIPIFEVHIEKLENAKWRKVFTSSNYNPSDRNLRNTTLSEHMCLVADTNFKTNYDPITNKPDGVSVDYRLDDLEVEFEITSTSVAIAAYNDDSFTNTWEVFGTPDNYHISDSAYNVDPTTQMVVPPPIMNYMLFLWKIFIQTITPERDAERINNELELLGN